MNSKTITRFLQPLGLLFLTGLSPALATPTFNWNTNTGSWSVAGNWSSNQVPTNSSTAYIDNGGTAILTNNGTAGNLYVGNTNTGSQLILTNGGSLAILTNMVIGGEGMSSNNIMKVLGASTLTVAGSSYLGGSSNSSSASGNVISIAGTRSVWNVTGNTSSITIYGSSNSLIVSNGGRISIASGSLDIGNDQTTNGSANRVIVSDRQSVISAPGGVYLGHSSDSNLLIVSNGASVTAGGGYVGFGSNDNSGNNNTMIITGTNSILNSTDAFRVGDGSGSNTLQILNGAKALINGQLNVGSHQGSGNAILVTGQGSLLSNSGTLNIGYEGTANTLTLDDRGVVTADDIAVTAGNSLIGNGTVTATGGTVINGGTFAPTGTNALRIVGGLTFTNSGAYLWNLFSNSTNNPSSGMNYTLPVVLNGNLSVSPNSVFDLNLGYEVNALDNFWTNNRQWTVLSGSGLVSSGTNFAPAFASNSYADSGLLLNQFSLVSRSNSLYLQYTAPFLTNPVINPGTTNFLPSYSNTNTALVINAPTNGTAILAASNPSLVSIRVIQGTLDSTNTESIPTNVSVAVYGGTMGFTGAGTNQIGSLYVAGGEAFASNTIISVKSFLQTGGNLSGESSVTFWAANYIFQATNPASVGVNLGNLGTVVNYHSTAIVTTNANGAPVAPVVFNTDMGYDGGTIITGGILQLGSSNSSGPVTVQGEITNNGYLNYGYNGDSSTPTNLVIGSGVIGQVGTGTLTVGSVGVDNNFTGSFASANGTLAITTNSALGGATNYYLADNGTLQATTDVTQITQSINVTNGTGVVENSNGGTLALNGTLTKSGTVLVLAGGDFAVNGQVTGSGAPGSFNSDLVVSNATATLNAGNNNYTGPTRLVAGSALTNGIDNALPTTTVLTVGGTGDGFVVNRYDLNGFDQTIAGLSSAGTANNIVTNGSVGVKTLTVNGATNTTYAGLIAGNVALVRSGTGAITLTQTNTYTGGTTINLGKLTVVNGSLGTGTVALNGGTLEVRSLLNIGAMTWSGGKVAFPTLTSFNGIYLVSTNGLTVTNSSHVFNLTGANLTIGKATPLLGATNMNTGTFSTNQFSVEGVSKYSLTISNDILWIDLLANPAPIVTAPAYPNLLGYAVNRNQSNVASALNGFTNSPNADQVVVLNSLKSLTNNADQMQQAFNGIMPTFYQQMATIAFNSANAQNMELSQRLWGLRVAEGGGFSMSGLADNYAMIQEGQGDGSGKGVLDAKKDILRPGLDNRWGMFVDGNGIFAQANSGNMLPGYKSQSGGITTGLTYKWNKSFASGIYAGYQGTYNKSGAAGSGLGVGSTLIDNAVRFGLFGTYGNPDGKGFYANALAGGGYNNYQASRIIEYPGMNRTANSSPGAGELDTMLGGGYDVQKGNFTFGPTASLQYTYLGVNGVNETGAQSLNFNSGGWNSSSMLSSVGAHAAYTWYAHKDIVVVPQVSLNWQHEFMQNPYAITGTLGGNSPVFSNWSAPGIRDYLYTGVGFTVEFAKRWNTSFFYNAVAGNQNLTSQNIFWSAGLKF